MSAGILYGRQRPVLEALGKLLYESMRHRGDDCRLAICVTGEELSEALALPEHWDLACMDIGNGDDMAYVFDVRQQCPQIELLLVVNRGVSPMVYIRPGVMPSGLVLQSADPGMVGELVDEFARHFLAKRLQSNEDECFAVETKDGVIHVPFASIVYFESRAKRIGVRAGRREYLFYDTLDHIQQVLPDAFMRCHRGFIINMSHVRRLHLGQSQIEMDDGSFVPVSRSYKASLKERML